VLIRKLQGKLTFGSHGHGWEDYVTVDVKEIVCDNVEWLQPALGRAHWWGLLMCWWTS